jgi:hypothetical protein
MTAIVLLVWVAEAIACAAIANHKGRNMPAWTGLGLAFGLIALIIVACLSEIEQYSADSSTVEFYLGEPERIWQ